MGKTAKVLEPTVVHDLSSRRTDCPHCGKHMRADYTNRRTVATLSGVARLNLTVRRCRDPDCAAHKRPYRPEAEGRFALPHHEFGLDVVAPVGRVRYAEHRSAPEIRTQLPGRGLLISEPTVTNLLDRYDELLAVVLADDRRLKKVPAAQGRVVLALDGLQPDVGREVLWVIRDVLGGGVLLAKSPPSARQKELSELLRLARDACGVPVAGVVSDGQHSIRNAVAEVFPGVPHRSCQFHFPREAAEPIHEADRHAEVQLKKKVRGVRKVERLVEGREGVEAEAVRGYRSAVRSALTDGGRPPLEASGLKLHVRLCAIAGSLGRAEARGDARPNSGA